VDGAIHFATARCDLSLMSVLKSEAATGRDSWAAADADGGRLPSFEYNGPVSQVNALAAGERRGISVARPEQGCEGRGNRRAHTTPITSMFWACHLVPPSSASVAA